MTKREIQTIFLEHICKARMAVTVFLINGVKLQGVIDCFDESSIMLERAGHKQVIYKHAISTIMPAEATPNLTEIEAKSDSQKKP